ncbi:unnamed protein product [Lactuca saligna]|uniref:Gnk2-homologous domain-containing protein n=1 Tax=Lactuca saligna TaxID=75948 RepID=A0AA36DZF8_LACSI|nr:unnamed protein product [Lactuca saligna]
MAHLVTSQKIDRNNTMLRWYCSAYRALCRAHLSTAECLSSFDSAVSYLKVCRLGNGARVFYDDCDLRYENKNFYDDAIMRTSTIGICGNTTSSHPKEQKKTASGFLSDLRTVIPRIPSYFAASTRQITGTNQTVYAIAQCGPNITQSMCEECLEIRLRLLHNCLPSTSGKAIDDGCFMRIFKKFETLIGGVVGGIGFLLVILAFFFWRSQSKKSKHRREDNYSSGTTDLLQRTTVYTYNDLKTATNNFSNENIIGGGFNMLYKFPPERFRDDMSSAQLSRSNDFGQSWQNLWRRLVVGVGEFIATTFVVGIGVVTIAMYSRSDSADLMK